MIHVIYRSGGIHGMGKSWSPSPEVGGAKLATMLSGLVIFFDDYSNTVVVGSTMRKVTDRWRFPGKTSLSGGFNDCAIAGLAMLSTWTPSKYFCFQNVAGARPGGGRVRDFYQECSLSFLLLGNIDVLGFIFD